MGQDANTTWTHHFSSRKKKGVTAHAHKIKGRTTTSLTKMAEMDETGQAFEDPAAAFLAREQNELADIAEDTLGFTPGASEVSVRIGSDLKL